MARKRKGGGRPFGHDGATASARPNDSKRTINTFEDVADSEDEFHINRDKILLEEGPSAKRMRLAQERDADLELSDEEVFAISGDEDLNEEEEDDVGDLEEDEDEYHSAEDGARAQSNPKNSKKLPSRPIQDSDSDNDGADDLAGEDDDNWGTSRQDYYNADINETEQDALAEEAEARRLQKKQLAKMTEVDFGFDPEEWKNDGDNENKNIASRDGRVTTVIPKLELKEGMSAAEKMNVLSIRYPEFERLADEFIDLQDLYNDLTTRASTEAKERALEQDPIAPASVLLIKQRSLAAYMATLSMYFVLFTNMPQGKDGKPSAISPEKLHNHTIMGTLVECRELWLRVKDLPEPVHQPQLSAQQSNGYSNGVSMLEAGAETATALAAANTPASEGKKRKAKKSRAQKAHEASIAAAEAERSARLLQAETSLAELNTLSKPTSKHKSKNTDKAKQNKDDDSDIGDPTALTAAEAQEKARNKKTLKFYTSQIAQRSNRRAEAGRATGGDDDLPYRERWKERQERLQTEAEKRGQKVYPPGADLGSDGEDDSLEVSNLARSRAVKATKVAGENEEDDYYDQVLSQSQDKKAAKAARAAAAAAAPPVRFTDDAGTMVEGDKRAVSYEIRKNKGLTPKRKKEVRNPRVKKRLRYEDKKKKLGSMKPVWKGGEGRGGYGGEATGIKTGLSRGVRLS